MNPAQTCIFGNVTNDPELTYTTSGQARLSFSVAVNRVWYDNSNEKQEQVSFFNVVAWRYIAENAAKTLEKGIGAVIVGRLEQRSYDDKEGNKRSVVEIVADEIGISTRSIEAVTRRQRAEGGQQTGAPQGGQRPSSGGQRRTRPMTSAPQPANVGAEEGEPF